MKRLGLLGGMSWESSIEYERTTNELVRERLGGVASADLLIRSFNFADIEELQRAGRWDDAGTTLAQAAANLVASGAEGVIAGCTEIELLIGQDDLPVPYFPTAYLHAVAAVDFALAP